MASWNRIFRWLGVVACATLAFAGCSTDPVEVPAPADHVGVAPTATPTVGFVAQETTINGYIVRFEGRTVSGGNTTFTYNVRGTGVDPTLSHFTVELPACTPALLSYSPEGSANINTNPQTGIYGIEWHLSVAKDNFAGRTYSITFPGDVPLGIVRSEVKTENGARGVGDVYGPCAGFRIGGTVFVDANNDGILDVNEGGIANVTVSITDGVETVTTTTDAGGEYLFVVLEGSYTVSIATSTPATDFNEDLFATFTVVTPTSLDITVGPDAPGTNFAFEPQSNKVISDLDTGILLTNGKPVRYWKGQLRNAINGKPSTYSAAQMLSFLQQIEGLGIYDPFQFGDGTELKDALAILSQGGQDPIVALKRELLTSELNFVSGNSLVGQEDLHEVLIIWGEEIVAQSAPSQLITMGAPAAGDATAASSMFQLMNGSTGGGGTDE